MNFVKSCHPGKYVFMNRSPKIAQKLFLANTPDHCFESNSYISNFSRLTENPEKILRNTGQNVEGVQYKNDQTADEHPRNRPYY